jgi:hypothetical protein
MQKAPSQFIVAARAQASRRCETQAPLSGKPLALLQFQSLDPFRAYREPDRRRRDEERGFLAPNKEPPTNQKHDLTGKTPYRFESIPLQQTVRLSRDFSFLYRKAGRCRGVRGLGQAAQPTETRTARHNHAHCR